MFRRLFLDHPRSVGETYLEHQHTALTFAGWMFVGSVACFVHAFFPTAFRTTGSRTVGKLYRRMILNRAKAENATTSTSFAAEAPGVDVWELWEI